MAKRWLDNSKASGSSSGGYTLENLESWINEQNSRYWVWTHILDLHDKNMFSSELDDNRFSTEIEELRQYLSGQKNGWSETNWSISQALSVRYVDATLERFFESVYEGREEPPLVVLTSDHGTMFPFRDGDYIKKFYDDLLHIPVVFIHPDIGRGSYDGLCSAIDIAPTVLDLLGMESPDGFKGESIKNLPEGGREYVVAEDMGRGPVDPIKPAKIAVRSANRKVVCSASILGEETKLEITAAYNLDTDPHERNPISGSELPDSFSRIINYSHQRANQIRRSIN
jgi:membrane-anchored protein YejM (alkaline phosphatase superfamily)